MAAPLYFFPDVELSQLVQQRRLNPELLARYGLLEALGDVDDVDLRCSLFELRNKGPGNKGGVLLIVLADAGDKPNVRCGYFPGEQHWTQVRSGPDLWIGLDRHSPVTPEGLQRPKGFKGYPVELGDGRTWIVPVVRRPDDSTNLPQNLAWDANGVFGRTIKEQYRELWEATALVIDWYHSDFAAESLPDLERAAKLCLQILGLNYRLHAELLGLLGLLDTMNWATVCACAIDGPLVMRMEAAEKKSKSRSGRKTSST